MKGIGFPFNSPVGFPFAGDGSPFAVAGVIGFGLIGVDGLLLGFAAVVGFAYVVCG